MKIDIKTLVKERNDALLSLDKKKIKRYLKKYHVHFCPSQEIVFWAAVHKAILGISSATPEQKQRSMTWLVQNGFKPWIE